MFDYQRAYPLTSHYHSLHIHYRLTNKIYEALLNQYIYTIKQFDSSKRRSPAVAPRSGWPHAPPPAAATARHGAPPRARRARTHWGRPGNWRGKRSQKTWENMDKTANIWKISSKVRGGKMIRGFTAQNWDFSGQHVDSSGI